MFLSYSVFRFQRLLVKCYADSLAQRFLQETVSRRQGVCALLFPRSTPRKYLTVSAPLTREMSVNPSPSRFAMISMSLVKSAMMFLRRFATMSLPQGPSMLMMSSAPMLVPGSVHQPRDRSAPMLLSKFQDKPTRLNARQNILKNVVNLAVVVMETKSFS